MVAWKLKPRCEDYTALIGSSRQNLQRCNEIFAQMKAAGIRPSNFVYQAMLEAHVLGRDVKGADALIAEAGSLLDSLRVSSRKFQQLLDDVEQMRQGSIADPF